MSPPRPRRHARRSARGLPLLALCLLLAASCGEEGAAPELPAGEVTPAPDTPEEDADGLRHPPGVLATSAIKVSASATRTTPVALAGATLKGRVAVFVAPPTGTTVQRVEFYVDDPQRQRAALRTEDGAPFDLGGTAADGSATLYDTRQLPDGVHSITALVRYTGRSSDVGTVQFTVANGVATPPPPPPADAGTGTGTPTCSGGQLLAQYFAGGNLSGSALLSRCETAVAHDWGEGSPGTGVPPDGFSARWTGQLTLPAGGVTVRARVDDGVRVWLGGRLLIDQWRQQTATHEASTTVTAGTHALKVEYFEASYRAVAQVTVTPAVSPAPDGGVADAGVADAGAPPPPPADGGVPLPVPTGPGASAVRNGRIEVDGQPFFPHGWYYVSWGHSASQMITNLRTIAAAGFNTVHASRTDSNGYDAFLDEAARLNVKVITEGAPNDVISALKGKRAVLGWNIGDDVHDTLTPTDVASRHQAARAADPNHFTYFTVYAPSKWGPFLDKGDVVAPYNYPVSSSWLGEVDYSMNLARGSGRPLIGIPQAFMWPGQRAPTGVEFRNMLYQNLVNDVVGLVHYNFHEGSPIPTKHPEIWAMAKALVPEVNRLAPALTQGTYTKLATGADRVVGATWRLGSELYVVVINTHETEGRSVSIPLSATGTPQALFAGRPAGLQLSGGRLMGTIAPRDVHVYVLTAL